MNYKVYYIESGKVIAEFEHKQHAKMFCNQLNNKNIVESKDIYASNLVTFDLIQQENKS